MLKKGVEKISYFVTAIVAVLFILFLMIQAMNWATCSVVGILDRTVVYRKPTVAASVPVQPKVLVTAPYRPELGTPNPWPKPVVRAKKKPVQAAVKKPEPPAPSANEAVVSQAPLPATAPATLSKKRVLIVYECPPWFWTSNVFPVVQSTVEQAILETGAEVIVFNRRQPVQPFDIAVSVVVREMPGDGMAMGQWNVPQRIAHVVISAKTGGVIYAQSVGQSAFYGQGCTACSEHAFDGYSAATKRAVNGIIPKLALK